MAVVVWWTLGGVAGAAIVWLVFGRWVVRPFDGWLLRAGTELATAPLAVNPDRFILGSRSWPFAEAAARGVRFEPDGAGRLVLTMGDDAGAEPFALGLVVNRLRCDGGMQYEFVPEAGDEVTFRLRPSRLAWPTPFHISIMGVRHATWRRRSFYCLRWEKSDGRRLEIVWEDEQGFYKGAGWREGYVDRLVGVKVT